MKTTIFFSNVIGDICSENCVSECEFNEHSANLFKRFVKSGQNLVFVNAPGFANDNLWFDSTIESFKKIGINFANSIQVDEKTNAVQFESFPKENRVYFLMGGNPLTQKKIIEKFSLNETLKSFDGVVIGFCAGAINLSKHSIITSDDDFLEPLVYDGIERVQISVEPHFKLDDTDFTKNRLKELFGFCEKIDSSIHAIPDTSCILIQNENVEFYGDVYLITQTSVKKI